MPDNASVVFLFDVDNTLLDNDRVVKDLKRHLIQAFGEEREEQYWCIFEELRREVGYADYLGALQNYRAAHPRDSGFLDMSLYLLAYPFSNRLFPGSLDVLDKFGAWGPTVILSDGDVVFQPRKIERSGLYETVEGRVLVYIHKEQELEDVAKRFPADHYVLIDDKVRILAAVKGLWKEKVTTVFPRQGHYAFDTEAIAKYRPADITVERIGDLVNFELAEILAAAG